jgi:protein-S-isoprenylcysteine O-methyltransferase Ste14
MCIINLDVVEVEAIIMEYIPILELLVLITMVLVRSMMLKRHGIKAIVFGVTDKKDYIIIPIVLFFFYGMFSTVFDMPFPAILKKYYWEFSILHLCGAVICTISLIWFGITLKAFGKSFRVGIDEYTKDKLITTGTFSISRNPIYLAFITFFLGVFIAHSNIITSIFLILVSITIHRQILREEEFLKGHYGNEYFKYCKKVRRYI